MSNNFRTIYLYIVSIITLGMIVGGIVSSVNNITSYFYPDSYVFFNETTYSTDSKYDYDYESSKNNLIERENYKNEKIKNTVVSVAVIVVGSIMYTYHWNIIEKERKK